MKISFITTVLNEECSIRSYLESLAKQSRPPDEVVIVDGGSRDQTVEEIKKCEGLFKGLRVLVKTCNIAEGRNIAVKAATGDIIVMSDAGCVLDKDWLKEIVCPIEEDNTVEICCGNWLIKKEQGLASVLCWYFLRGRPDMREGPANMEMPSARSVGIRRETWVQMGGHPEFLYAGEDTLFNLKCQFHNKRFVFVKRAICYWVMHKSLAGFGKQIFNYARSRGRLCYSNDLEGLGYLLRYCLVYGISFSGMIIGVFLLNPWNLVLCSTSLLLFLLSIYRHKSAEFIRAKRYGFSLGKVILGVLLTFYGDWKIFGGILTGIQDRITHGFDIKAFQYIADVEVVVERDRK